MKWAVSVVVTVAALVAVEAAARHDDGTLYFPTDGRRFATLPHTRSTNAEGYLERAWDALPEGPRMLVLGDSVTAGHDDPAHAWTRSAEVPGRVWVNLAHNGYDAEQSLAVLRRAPMPAAWVIYAAYVNDIVPTELITVGTYEMPAWVGDRGYWPWLRARSAAWRRMAGAVASRRYAERSDPARWERAMLEMRALAIERGARFGLVGIAPHVFSEPSACVEQLGMDGCRAANAALATFADAAQRAGVPYLDTAAMWRRDDGQGWFIPGRTDPHHPNAEGQARLGRHVAAWLESLVTGADAAEEGGSE